MEGMIGTKRVFPGCRSVDEFEILSKLGHGSYGVVYKARDTVSGEVVALKRLKNQRDGCGFPVSSLREFMCLSTYRHPCIVALKGVAFDGDFRTMFVVMEYVEHDLRELVEADSRHFTEQEVKAIMHQLLGGVAFLHSHDILHRDLKTSNILVSDAGSIKIADFGLCRRVYGLPKEPPLTPRTGTPEYMAPELLFEQEEYTSAVDVWSVGCIMAELLAKERLFAGRNAREQVMMIWPVVGEPGSGRLRELFPAMERSGRPGLSAEGFNLLERLLAYHPDERITAAEAVLNHPWFEDILG